MSRIFISYKRSDKEKVFRIKDRIEAATGEKCWIDLDGIESDAQFVNVIMRAIDNADIFLFMFSKTHSEISNYENDWTIREIGYAQAQQKRIVIVNIDGTPMSKWFQFMFGLKQQVDATSEHDVNKLSQDICRWLNETHPSLPIRTTNNTPSHKTQGTKRKVVPIAAPEKRLLNKKWLIVVACGVLGLSIIGILAGMRIHENKQAHAKCMAVFTQMCESASIYNVGILSHAWDKVRQMDDIENYTLYFGDRTSLELKKDLSHQVVDMYNESVDLLRAESKANERNVLCVQQDSIEQVMMDMNIHDEEYDEQSNHIISYEFLGEQLYAEYVVITATNVCFRSSPDESGKQTGSNRPHMNTGDTFVFLGAVKDYYKILVGDVAAYVPQKYAKIRSSETPQFAVITGNDVCVRNTPNESGKDCSIKMYKDEAYVCLGESGDYYKIEIADQQYYVPKRYAYLR
ncbi:MAG: toll/interleukin-1 receptor domain-containing protein [Paludibacteraceae bacterium]|nr:toll/interleukin-1 receptor domain-containing protein [Paludibacteraceae bacterium]